MVNCGKPTLLLVNIVIELHQTSEQFRTEMKQVYSMVPDLKFELENFF